MEALWEQERLRRKLELEIARLEKWLASQPAGTTFKGFKGSSISLVPTIVSLIETRKRLLASLEFAPEGSSEQGQV